MASSPALISEKNLSIISMMLDGIERDMEHSRHLVQVKNLKQENFEETINYLTRDNLIVMDLLKEAEERFEINLQETSATITDLKKYYEEKLQTGEGELERIVEQCNTAQRERDNLMRSLLAAEESSKDLNRKYLLSEKNNKSQILVIEDLKEQNSKQDDKIKQLSDYCAMLEQSHAEMNAYQKDKAVSAKQTMRSEVDRYYQQVTQLQIRVHDLELENAMLKSSQFGREGKSSSSAVRAVGNSSGSSSSCEDSLLGKSYERPHHTEGDHDSQLLININSSRSSDRQPTTEQHLSESPSLLGYDSRGQVDSDVDAVAEGEEEEDYQNQQIYFASSGDKYSEDSMNNWDLDAGLSAWHRSEELAATHPTIAGPSLHPWDTATDRDMQQPLEMDPDDVTYDPNRLWLSPADDPEEVTQMVQLYRQLLGNTADGMGGEEKDRWANSRVVETHEKTDGDGDHLARDDGQLVSSTDHHSSRNSSNMLLWLATTEGGAGGSVGVDDDDDDDDYYNPMEDEENDSNGGGGGEEVNLQDLSRLD